MQTVGTTLTAMRIRRGRTLDEVATRTRIPKRIVVALENDDYSELPASVYVKGFIRALCRELGYDGNEVVQMYDSARFVDTLDPAAAGPLLVLRSERPTQDAAGPKGLRMAHALVLLVAALTFLGAILTAAMRDEPEAAAARPAAIRTSAPTPARVTRGADPRSTSTPRGPAGLRRAGAVAADPSGANRPNVGGADASAGSSTGRTTNGSRDATARSDEPPSRP